MEKHVRLRSGLRSAIGVGLESPRTSTPPARKLDESDHALLMRSGSILQLDY